MLGCGWGGGGVCVFEQEGEDCLGEVEGADAGRIISLGMEMLLLLLDRLTRSRRRVE